MDLLALIFAALLLIPLVALAGLIMYVYNRDLSGPS
jgi:hypothetical protein